MAKITIMTMVMPTAANIGMPISNKRTKVKAANKTIAPCAKLNTPEALKINTKPNATSEYITPDKRPPTKTSKKNHQSIILLLGTHQSPFVLT